MKMTKIIIIFSAILVAIFFGFNNLVKAIDPYDLKADSLIMNSINCEINQPCSFTATAKNLGADFTLNYHLDFSVSGDGYVAGSQNSILPALGTVIKTNDYLTFNFSGSFTKIGSVALDFTVNSNGYLVESDGNNNTSSLTVSTSGYDLAIENIVVLPASPMVNQDCYIQVKVKNNSSYRLYDGRGLDSIKVFPDFIVAGASSTEPSLSNLINSGGYLYYGYEGKFIVSGEKQLSFTVDSEDALEESDSTNNIKTTKITVYNQADTDLTIDSVNFSTDKIISGKPFDIIIGVKNAGKTYLTDSNGLSQDDFGHNLGSYVYGLYDLSPDPLPTLNLPLKPDDILYYRFHGIFDRPGNLNLNFAINQNRRLIEANINNNATSTEVMVYKTQVDADSFLVLSKKVSFASSTAAIINWTTDHETTGAINYIIVAHNISDDWVEDNYSTTTHATLIDGLIPGENYNYFLTAKSGVVEKTELVGNFVMPQKDILKISAGPSVSLSGKNAAFSWTTNLISSDKVYYKKQGAVEISSAGANALAAEHMVLITDLAPGRYDYFVSSTSTPGSNAKTAWAGFEIKETPAASTAGDEAIAKDNSASVSASSGLSYSVINNNLYERLKGKIILRVENHGEAYYISPKEKKLYYLGRPADAFQVIRGQGVGIISSDLAKISVSLNILSGADFDEDGLPDAFEEAIGTDKTKADSDGDGFGDKDELAGDFSPLAKNQKLVYSQSFANQQKGKIFLQVESHGEAWYINPVDGRRYFLARPTDAFNIMRRLGAGIGENDYAALGGK